MSRPADKYTPNDADGEALQKAFSYHAPTPNQIPRYEHLRSQAKAFATDLLALCPPSRERSLAMTKLEEAVMWANASIARNE